MLKSTASPIIVTSITNLITCDRLLEVVLILYFLAIHRPLQWEFPERENNCIQVHGFNTYEDLKMVVHSYLISKGFQHYAQA